MHICVAGPPRPPLAHATPTPAAAPQMRFLLHAPLQLASVLFAASATTEVCGALFGSTSRWVGGRVGRCAWGAWP